jgi:Glycosyltransferase family 20
MIAMNAFNFVNWSLFRKSGNRCSVEMQPDRESSARPDSIEPERALDIYQFLSISAMLHACFATTPRRDQWLVQCDGLIRTEPALLAAPPRDGINLVAKEYIAAQNPNDPGVLILSRFASAAHECKETLLVNPYDPDSVAVATGQALAMPLTERREWHKAIFEVLSHNHIQSWADRFLSALQREPSADNRLHL